MKTLVNTTGLTEDQQMMRETLLDILAKTLPRDEIMRLDDAREFPHAAYEAIADAGFLSLFFEEEFGGSAASYKDLTLFMETLGYHYAGIGQAVMITNIYAGSHLSKFGSQELKSKIIPEVIEGKLRLCLAMSEPGTGSDVAGMRAKAELTPEGYRLSGTKVWISGAHVADYAVVIAKTDTNAARHEGLSTFLVDLKSDGVTVNPLSMLGRRTTHANEIVLDNVLVPRENLIGEEGKTWRNLMKGLAMERLGLAAIAAGNCFRVTEDTRDYALQRTQFDQPISNFQTIQHKLVDMWTMSEVARQSVYRVAELLDSGEPAIEETSIAKITATDNNFKCADLGLQVYGGSGYAMEYEMQMYFRDARVGPIGGGTNEIQKNVLAKRMGV